MSATVSEDMQPPGPPPPAQPPPPPSQSQQPQFKRWQAPNEAALPPPQPDDRTVFDPNVISCVFLTVTANALAAKDPRFPAGRRETAAGLRRVAGERLAWLDDVVRTFVLARHSRVRAAVAAVRDHIADALARWDTACDYGADDFYDRFQAESVPIIKALCRGLDEGVRAHLRALVQDTQLVVDGLKHAPAVTAAGPDALRTHHRELSVLVSRLIETIRIAQEQPTIGVTYRNEIGGFGDAIDVANELLTHALAVELAHADDQEYLVAVRRHFEDLDLIASDLMQSLNSKMASADLTESYKIYVESVYEANACYSKCKEMFESEIATVDMHGACTALSISLRRRSLHATAHATAHTAVSTDLSDAAREIDIVDKALERINFTIAFPENIPELLSIVDELQSVFEALPQRIVRIARANTADLLNHVTAFHAAIDSARQRLSASKQAFVEARSEPNKVTDALVVNAELHAAVQLLLETCAEKNSLLLFDNAPSLTFRTAAAAIERNMADLDNKLQHMDGGSTRDDVRVSIDAAITLLANFGDMLTGYTEATDALAETEASVYREVQERTVVFVRTSIDALVSAAKVVASQGVEDGRNWPLLDACRAFAVFIDIATHVVANAYTLDVVTSAPESSPESTPASRPAKAATRRRTRMHERTLDDLLPGVRTLFNLLITAHELDDVDVDEPGQHDVPQLGSGTGAVKTQNKTAASSLTYMARLGIAKQGSGPDQPAVVTAFAPLDANVAQRIQDGAVKSLWTETGKPVLDISATTGEVNVLAGSLNQLVNFYTQPEMTDKSQRFQSTFLLTLSTFVDPLVFLKKLAERYKVLTRPVDAEAGDYNLAFKYPIQLRVCDALKQWMARRGCDDFANQPAVVRALSDFLDTDVANESKMIARNLRRCFDVCAHRDRFVANEKWARATNTPIYEQMKVARAPVFQEMASVFDPRRAAIQMAVLDSAVFRAISLHELADQKWLRPDAAQVAPRLFEMIDSFNRMACFVAKTVLLEPTMRRRRKVIGKFIGMAAQVHRLRNFHTVFSIIAGLKLNAITRLHETWSQVPAKTIQTMEDMFKLMNPDHNYAAYRQAFAAASQPRIPYLAVILQDLFRLEAAYRSSDMNKMIMHGQIDWTFREDVARTVLKPFVHDRNECYYRLNVVLLTSLLNGMDDCLCDDAELMRLSRIAEPGTAVFKPVTTVVPSERERGRPTLLRLASLFSSLRSLV